MSSTNDKWRPLPSAGEPAPRAQCSFAFNGRELFVLWGLPDSENDALADGAAYDPAARRWRKLDVPRPRWRAKATALSDGGLFIFGGAPVEDDDSVQSWVMESNETWRAASVVGAPKGPQSKLARVSDLVVVWTGKEPGATYDPKADRWRALATDGAPTPSLNQACTSDGVDFLVWRVEKDGALSAGGGLYDPRHDKWSSVPAPPGDAEAMALGTPLLTGERIFVSGYNDDANEFVVWMFDRTRSEWSRGPTIEGLAETQHECVWTGSELILFGGTGEDSETTRNVFAFSPDSDEWRALPAIPWAKPRLEFAWAFTGQTLIVWSGMEDEQSMPGGFEISLSGRPR